jgi:hypothetical protein
MSKSHPAHAGKHELEIGDYVKAIPKDVQYELGEHVGRVLGFHPGGSVEVGFIWQNGEAGKCHLAPEFCTFLFRPISRAQAEAHAAKEKEAKDKADKAAHDKEQAHAEKTAHDAAVKNAHEAAKEPTKAKKK